MGLYFRKSTKIGPVRLNFSKNGIGWSVGGKYLRYGKTATGKKYVSGGAHGIYFREYQKGNKAPRKRNTATYPNSRTQQSLSPYFIVPMLGIVAFMTSPLWALWARSWSTLFWIAGIGVCIFILGLFISISPNQYKQSTQTKNSASNEFPTQKSTYQSEMAPNNSHNETDIEITNNINHSINCLPDKFTEDHYIENSNESQQIDFDSDSNGQNRISTQDMLLKKTAMLNNQGIEFEKQNSLDGAIYAYEKNVELGYPARHAYDRLLVIYRKLGRKDDEIRIAELAIKMFPQETSYLKRLNDLKGERKIILPQQAIVSHPRIIYGDLFETAILKVPEFDFYSNGYENQAYYHSLISGKLDPVNIIRRHFNELLSNAKAEDDYGNYAGSAAIYEQIVAERYWMPAPYDRLVKIYAKAKLKYDEKRILEIAIPHFKQLKESRLEYVMFLARKYNAVEFAKSRIENNKKISYYSGVFELYNPFTIIPKWEMRLQKLSSSSDISVTD